MGRDYIPNHLVLYQQQLKNDMGELCTSLDYEAGRPIVEDCCGPAGTKGDLEICIASCKAP